MCFHRGLKEKVSPPTVAGSSGAHPGRKREGHRDIPAVILKTIQIEVVEHMIRCCGRRCSSRIRRIPQEAE